MSTFRPPAGIFELQQSSSFKAAPSNYQYADENEGVESDRPQEESDYEEEVDESVREDMTKLEDTFPGISDRFRLVNRIGEGTLYQGQAEWMVVGRYANN